MENTEINPMQTKTIISCVNLPSNIEAILKVTELVHTLLESKGVESARGLKV